jgi:hypothetical protein
LFAYSVLLEFCRSPNIQWYSLKYGGHHWMYSLKFVGTEMGKTLRHLEEHLVCMWHVTASISTNMELQAPHQALGTRRHGRLNVLMCLSLSSRNAWTLFDRTFDDWSIILSL